jgi:hypothetical protein
MRNAYAAQTETGREEKNNRLRKVAERNARMRKVSRVSPLRFLMFCVIHQFLISRPTKRIE